MTDFTDESHIRHSARRLIEDIEMMPPCTSKVALLQELFGRDWRGVERRLQTAREKYLRIATEPPASDTR